MSITPFDHRVLTERFFAIRNLNGGASFLVCQVDSRNLDGSIEITVANGAYCASISAAGVFVANNDHEYTFNVELIWQGSLPPRVDFERSSNEVLNYIDRQIKSGMTGAMQAKDMSVTIQRGLLQDAINELAKSGNEQLVADLQAIADAA